MKYFQNKKTIKLCLQFAFCWKASKIGTKYHGIDRKKDRKKESLERSTIKINVDVTKLFFLTSKREQMPTFILKYSDVKTNHNGRNYLRNLLLSKQTFQTDLNSVLRNVALANCSLSDVRSQTRKETKFGIRGDHSLNFLTNASFIG